jgi:hypothetical protein
MPALQTWSVMDGSCNLYIFLINSKQAAPPEILSGMFQFGCFDLPYVSPIHVHKKNSTVFSGYGNIYADVYDDQHHEHVHAQFPFVY